MSLFGARKHAKHAKPSKAAPLVVGGGMSAAFVVADASAASAATASDFYKLRVCESGNDYSINTGNGYYGAYQFNLATWRGLGFSGYPHQASPGTQDAAARKLQSQRGWQPWPACSRKMGLTSGRGSADTVSAAEERSTPERASRTRSRKRTVTVKQRRVEVRVAVVPTTPPRFDGHVLTLADRDQYRIAVKHWQRRMAARGWDLAVDGYFGPQTAAVAAKFAKEKQLPVALPGEVDRSVWDAAWRLPVN